MPYASGEEPTPRRPASVARRCAPSIPPWFSSRRASRRRAHEPRAANMPPWTGVAPDVRVPCRGIPRSRQRRTTPDRERRAALSLRSCSIPQRSHGLRQPAQTPASLDVLPRQVEAPRSRCASRRTSSPTMRGAHRHGARPATSRAACSCVATSRRRSTAAQSLRLPRSDPRSPCRHAPRLGAREPEYTSLPPRTWGAHPKSASPLGDSPRLGCLLRAGPSARSRRFPVHRLLLDRQLRPARPGAERHRIEIDGRVQVAVMLGSAALAPPAARPRDLVPVAAGTAERRRRNEPLGDGDLHAGLRGLVLELPAEFLPPCAASRRPGFRQRS